jgi:hypothetical protein
VNDLQFNRRRRGWFSVEVADGPICEQIAGRQVAPNVLKHRQLGEWFVPGAGLKFERSLRWW